MNEQNLEQVCNYFSKILSKALNILDIQKNIQTLLANPDFEDGDEEALMAISDEELDFDEIDMFSNLSQIITPLD